jgi:GTP diphosphokinase / guanosine-3',5'-bis(diphosphate) 3'-diphosphatase
MLFNEKTRKRSAEKEAPSPQVQPAGMYREKLEALLTVCANNLRDVDEDLITRAFDFAVYAHKDHRRKSGELYFMHPYAVAMIVAQEIPLDDASVAAALLHDVIEDCEDIAYEDILDEFGTTIADIVDGATKISNILKSREVTKAESYRKLLVSMINDIRVILVKFADRLHNMRTLEFVSKEKQHRISGETLEIYAPLAHRFGLARIKWELEDQSFKYLHEEDYRKLKEQVSLRRRERETYIMKFRKPIEEKLKEKGFTFDINGRPKHLYSIYKKMIDQNKMFDEIYDLFAIRIIIDTKEETDCYVAYAVVSEIYTPIPERFKNYIALPKQNGYRSIHTTVLGPDGKMVEVQMRTKEMHDISERGIAAHWAYKESVANIQQNAYDKWIRWVREILEQPLASSSEEEDAKQLIEDFKQKLYQDEIVVFTPKGDLIVLPQNATPVDFGFEIHSEVGLHCIGAKVNGRIVPLNSNLKSGDQIEIITSRNQNPSPDWEQFVVTHKAKVALRKWVNEQTKVAIGKGKERWERKAKKLKLRISDEMLQKAATHLNFRNSSQMFVALGNEEISAENIAEALRAPESDEKPEPPPFDAQESFENFAEHVRDIHQILVEGEPTDILYQFAKCCSPLPGDDIVGFVTLGHGLKIHQKNCRNIVRLIHGQDDGDTMKERLVEVSWPPNSEGVYIGGIRITGSDRTGILNEISIAISSYKNTNIHSVSIESFKSGFHGSVLVTVKDLDHLQRLIDRLKKVKGVEQVDRYIEAS